MRCKAALQVFAIAACLTGCTKYKYHEDNLIEELVEEAIEQQTGSDIDFSPTNKEKGFNPKSFVPVSKLPEKK